MNGRFVTWTKKEGLLNNVICQIMEDGRGNLWLGSYGGVFRINKQELNESAAADARDIHCVGYNTEDGLPTLECQGGFQPSGYRSPDGRLWFPTVKGLVVVDPAKVSQDSTPPNVVIEEVLADGSTIAITNQPDSSVPDLTLKVVVPAGSQRLEFQYTALSLTSPMGVHFKCRLEGLEQDWEDAGSKRNVEYRHVPEGIYRFRVTAGNSDGVWNETGAAVTVVVLPYFWETKWFLALSLLAGLASVASIVRYSERRRMHRRLAQAERERSIEKERARIARDIHDELGANLTEIALLSEFAQETTASQAQVQADMQKITARARNLTQMMDEVVWAVTPQNDTLEKFVTYTCSFIEEYLQTAKLACRLEVPEVLPEIMIGSEVRHNLFLSVKEALNNVVKHAQASEVRIYINLDSRRLTVAIQDNGKGFKQHAGTSHEQTHNAGEQQDGLYNIRQRMKNISGEMELESRPGRTYLTLVILLASDSTKRNPN
jgi:signal transduction histidine kinase